MIIYTKKKIEKNRKERKYMNEKSKLKESERNKN